MTTYYIDPTATTNGNGLSTSTPFNSWSSVTWAAGNTYLQKGGTTYNGTILVTVTGTAALPIIVGSYDPDTGTRTTNGIKRAKINGKDTRLTVRASSNVNWVTFDNLEIYGTTGTGSQNGIAVYLGSDSTTVSNDCTISNCWIHDVTGLLSPSTDSNGIMVFGSRNRIINNIIERVSADGIWGQGDNFHIVGNTIRNTSMENTRGDCIQLYGTVGLGCSNAYVAYNILDHSNKESKQCLILGDVSGIAYSSRSRIEFNECKMKSYEGSIQTTCILSYGDNAVIRGNTCFGGYTGIYFDGATSLITGNDISRSVVGITHSDTATGSKVYNNNVSSCSYAGIYSRVDSTFTAKNNYIANCANGIGIYTGAAEDYNNIINCTVTRFSTGGAGPTYGSNDAFTETSGLRNKDGKLVNISHNPLSYAGTYIRGVSLINNRTRPGLTPIGAYQVGRV